MNRGPLEFVEIVFPGNQFRGEIVPALKELADTNTIRILDLAVVSKTADGDVLAVEISDLDPGASTPLLEMVEGGDGLFSDDDFIAFGENLEPNSTAALLVFENTWATRFVDAVHRAHGEVVLNERIPRAVVEELSAAIG